MVIDLTTNPLSELYFKKNKTSQSKSETNVLNTATTLTYGVGPFVILSFVYLVYFI